jgi:tripartite-type tricarboxylate transporter receptor subunit TctC
MRMFPDTATVKEQGFQVVHLTPLGLAGPKGLQPNVLKILHEGFRKAIEDSSFIAAMDEMENPILYLGPEAYEKAWAASNIEEKERVRKFLVK